MSTVLMMMVFLPMAKRRRKKQIVRCPETDQPAQILVDTAPSSVQKRGGS
jgi:hypothetical protein